MLVAREEPLGLGGRCSAFQRLDDVIRQANDTGFGWRPIFLCTRSEHALSALPKRLEYGMSAFNYRSASSTEVAPFGGIEVVGAWPRGLGTASMNYC